MVRGATDGAQTAAMRRRGTGMKMRVRLAAEKVQMHQPQPPLQLLLLLSKRANGYSREIANARCYQHLLLTLPLPPEGGCCCCCCS